MQAQNPDSDREEQRLLEILEIAQHEGGAGFFYPSIDQVISEAERANSIRR
ncbi:MAG: hypothetical protein MRJ92_01490 [Nitrospira sp.]|nr:hypothetical protein [Nitrospira sp.]